MGIRMRTYPKKITMMIHLWMFQGRARRNFLTNDVYWELYSKLFMSKIKINDKLSTHMLGGQSFHFPLYCVEY